MSSLVLHDQIPYPIVYHNQPLSSAFFLVSLIVSVLFIFLLLGKIKLSTKATKCLLRLF